MHSKIYEIIGKLRKLLYFWTYAMSCCHMLKQLHGYYNNLNYYLIIISHKYVCNLKYKHSF
jgi:hypothetical protein